MLAYLIGKHVKWKAHIGFLKDELEKSIKHNNC